MVYLEKDKKAWTPNMIVLIGLLYYRHYMPMAVFAILLHRDQSFISRQINAFTNALFRLSKDHIQFEEPRPCVPYAEHQVVMVLDGCERPVYKPEIIAEELGVFSGKKKACTYNFLVAVDPCRGRPVFVSKTYEGSCNDDGLTESAFHVEFQKGEAVVADKGFRALHRLYGDNSIVPFHCSPVGLSDSEQRINDNICKIRIIIEQFFAVVKRFKIMSHPFRCKLSGMENKLHFHDQILRNVLYLIDVHLYPTGFLDNDVVPKYR